MTTSPGPAIDRAVLDALVEQIGADDVATIVGLFVTAAPERANGLAAAEHAADAASLAHALRSNAALLGATRLASLTRVLQTAAESGDEWRGARDEVVAELAAAARALEQQLPG